MTPSAVVVKENRDKKSHHAETGVLSGNGDQLQGKKAERDSGNGSRLQGNFPCGERTVRTFLLVSLQIRNVVGQKSESIGAERARGQKSCFLRMDGSSRKQESADRIPGGGKQIRNAQKTPPGKHFFRKSQFLHDAASSGRLKKRRAFSVVRAAHCSREIPLRNASFSAISGMYREWFGLPRKGTGAR